jgi:F-box protein 9
MTPIYVDSKQSWELTWPIWHMLPRSERKIIARQYGYNTIGDFEEFMSLNRALSQDSSEVAMHTPTLSHTHNNHVNHSSTMEHAVLTPLNIPPPQNMESLSDDEGDNTSGGDKHNELESKEDLIDDLESSSLTISRQQALVNGGRILMLPDDVLMYRILAYLDIDYFAVCALVSPHWKSFTRTEAVYREICHRCYLQQSKRKELHVVRFGNSYRNMLYMRPRVAYCGLYVLKFSQIKKIQRDMWTEVSKMLYSSLSHHTRELCCVGLM